MGNFLELVSENGWEYVIRKNTKGVVIICVYNKDNNKYLVVEQYRIPVRKRLIEFPAGIIENNETIIECSHKRTKRRSWFVMLT